MESSAAIDAAAPSRPLAPEAAGKDPALRHAQPGSFSPARNPPHIAPSARTPVAQQQASISAPSGAAQREKRSRRTLLQHPPSPWNPTNPSPPLSPAPRPNPT